MEDVIHIEWNGVNHYSARVRHRPAKIASYPMLLTIDHIDETSKAEAKAKAAEAKAKVKEEAEAKARRLGRPLL